MTTKQELVTFVNNRGQDIKMSEIEQFLNTKNKVNELEIFNSRIYVGNDFSNSYAFSTSDDIKRIIKGINFADKVTIIFNQINPTVAGTALLVLIIFVRELDYRINNVAIDRIEFVKRRRV